MVEVSWIMQSQELTSQPLSDGAIGHELVDKHLLPLLITESHKAHQVPVMHSWEEFNLVLEFLCPLNGPLLCPLHCHQFARSSHNSLVHLPGDGLFFPHGHFVNIWHRQTYYWEGSHISWEHDLPRSPSLLYSCVNYTWSLLSLCVKKEGNTTPLLPPAWNMVLLHFRVDPSPYAIPNWALREWECPWRILLPFKGEHIEWVQTSQPAYIFPKGKPLGFYMVGWKYLVHRDTPVWLNGP